MSGGAWDFVMGNYNNLISGSGFSIMPESKYYDKYTNEDILTTCNGKECLSHGLSETSGWYNDWSDMPNEIRSWIVRGGRYFDDKEVIKGVITGIFYFYESYGNNDYNRTFRLILVTDT